MIKLSKYTLVHILIVVITIIIVASCANTSSGAIEYNTTSYFINGKFEDAIPDSIIRKVYGFVITEQDGSQHSYRIFREIKSYDRKTLFCTAHKKWEVVSAFWQSEKARYEYMVRTHRKN